MAKLLEIKLSAEAWNLLKEEGFAMDYGDSIASLTLESDTRFFTIDLPVFLTEVVDDDSTISADALRELIMIDEAYENGDIYSYDEDSEDEDSEDEDSY